MATMSNEEGLTFERIDLETMPDNVDLAGGSSPDAWRFVQSVLDRAAEAHDDLVVALLVRARDERGREQSVPLETFLQQQGFDVAELEAELDVEDE